MRRAVCIVLLILTVSLCGCREEQPVLAKNTLYAYDLFLDDVPEEVAFCLKGKMPSQTREEGTFSGLVEVTEADGTKHTYRNLSYVWVDGWLLLHSGDPAAENGTGVLCWVDPQSPEYAFIADRSWREKNESTEMTAYVSNQLTHAEKLALGSRILQIEGVIEAVFLTAEEAVEGFLEALGNESFAEIGMADVRARYQITVETKNLRAVQSQLETIEGIEAVSASWSPESIGLIGPEKEYGQMSDAFWELPKLPEE